MSLTFQGHVRVAEVFLCDGESNLLGKLLTFQHRVIVMHAFRVIEKSGQDDYPDKRNSKHNIEDNEQHGNGMHG